MYRGSRARCCRSCPGWRQPAPASTSSFKFMAEAPSRSPIQFHAPRAGRPGRHRRRHLPGGADHRSPDHVAHLRHGARQPRRRHRPHPGACVRRGARLRAGGHTLHVLRVVRATSRSSSTRWVRDAVSRCPTSSRPAIRCASSLQRLVPSSLMGPASNSRAAFSKIITAPLSPRWQAACKLSYIARAAAAARHLSRGGGRGALLLEPDARGRHDDCTRRG